MGKAKTIELKTDYASICEEYKRLKRAFEQVAPILLEKDNTIRELKQKIAELENRQCVCKVIPLHLKQAKPNE